MGRLFDAVTALPAGRQGGCKVGDLLDQLDAEDRTDLVALLSDPAVTSAAIQRSLETFGFEVSYNSIIRHRRKVGGCKCPAKNFE